MTKPADNTPEALAAYLDPRLRPWLERGARVVAGRVEDAATHAEKALTKALIGTPDGRASWAKVQQSPSYLAALNRLDEILDAVAGPTRRSLAGLASDARADALAEGLGYWPAALPEALLESRIGEPTRAQIGWARGLVVFGQDDRTALAGPVDAARRSLTTAVLAAAMQNAKASEQSRLIGAWADTANLTIGRAVANRLRDSYTAAFNAAGRLVVHPDFHAGGAEA